MTPARAAREACGLSLQEAARQARVTPGYLARIERRTLRGQSCSFALARRLAGIYGCRMEVFVSEGSQPAQRPCVTFTSSKKRARR